VTTLWDSLSPLGLTITAGLAEELSEVGLARASWRQFASACEKGSIPAGSHSTYRQRRGQAHLERNDETPETIIGAWRRDGHRVSRFGVRPRAVRLVERAHARAELVRRRSLPRSFLSPFALVIPPFRRRFRPKEGSLLCPSSSLAREQ
jgi:hypothetical protein